MGMDLSEDCNGRKTLERSRPSSSCCVSCTCRGIGAAALLLELSNQYWVGSVCWGKDGERRLQAEANSCASYFHLLWYFNGTESSTTIPCLVKLESGFWILSYGVTVHTPLEKSGESSDVHKASPPMADHSPPMSDHIGLSLARISIGWVNRIFLSPDADC